MVFSISRGITYSLLFAFVGVWLSELAIAQDVELKSLDEEVYKSVDFASNSPSTIDPPTSTSSIASSTSNMVPTVPSTPSEPPSTTVSSSVMTEPSTTASSNTVSSEETSVTSLSTEIPSTTPPITLASESSTDTTGTDNTSLETSTPEGQNPTTTSDPSQLPNPPGAKAPTWAIVLLSILLCFAAIFTGLYFLRKHLLRKRQMDRRRLLSTRGSQEGFFMGSDTAFENGRL